MRLRNTILLFLALIAAGAYMYYVERPKQEEAAKKKTLYDAKAEDITAVRLTYSDREIDLAKQGDTWRMSKPVDAAGDESAVKNMVNSVVACEVTKELKEPSTDAKAYGLDAPFVTVTLSAGDKQLPKAVFGKTAPIGSAAYIRREGETAVLLVSSSCRAGVDKQTKDLRDKTLVELKDEDVRALQIQRGGASFSVERKDGGWEVAPGPYKGDDNTVRTYLSSLRTVRAVEFPDDAPTDLAPYGLDQPRLEVRARFNDDRELIVKFGKELSNKNVYIQTSNLPGVYEVGEYSYRNLDKTINDFRDKKLLAFDVDALQTIDVTRKDGGAYKLARKDDAWTIEGVEGTPKTDVIQEYVGDVQDLSGFEIIAEQPADLKPFGFDSPRLRIALTGKDGNPMGTILIGQMPNDEQLDMTAMVEGGTTVYKVRAYIFSRLNREPSKFVEAPPATPTAAT
jgi:hypothetical protein